MTAFIENIKRMMGWCPNVSTIETRKSVQFDDLMVKAPETGGELTLTTAGWWNKYRNRVLFYAFISTVLAITWFNIWFKLGAKENMNLFLTGLITGVS